MIHNDYYVYQLVNSLDNKPFYIGKGRENRIHAHILEAHRNGDGCNPKKIFKIRSIEREDGKILEEKLIDNLTEIDALDMEEVVIRRYGLENLTNLTYGGEGLSRECTSDTRQKISNALKGIRRSESTKEKIRKARLGTHRSLKTRNKISISHMGKKRSPEFCEKISLFQLGHRVSTNTREKIRQKNIGRKISEETRKKLSISHKGYVIKKETRIKLSNSNKGKHFHSVSGETRNKISNKLKGRKLSAITKEKIRKGHMGLKHPHTEETKEKIRQSLLKKVLNIQ